MAIRYSQEFKDQAIEKTLQRGDKTIQCIADELNINLFTLKEWLRKAQPTMTSTSNPQRPADWTPKQRFEALMKSAGLAGESLSAFCREQGLFPHHLETWKQGFITGNPSPGPATDKALRTELGQVKKELNRKEKALAEAAALLVLQIPTRGTRKVPSVLGGKGMMIAFPERQQLLNYFDEAVSQGARRTKAANIIGLRLRTLQRWRQPETLKPDGRTQRQFTPPNKLTDEERENILALANSEEFKNRTPHQIVPMLAERGVYIASESSFYRVLKEADQLKHRHASRAANPCSKPKALTASAPNQVYSWDITYLATLIKGQFFYLYLFMDIFSRKIVGWQVYHEESSSQAADVMRDICQREGIPSGQLVLHSDNGSPMKGATMLATLQKLGVAPSRSRPSVSNDNPYSEALFKTLKYGPRWRAQTV